MWKHSSAFLAFVASSTLSSSLFESSSATSYAVIESSPGVLLLNFLVMSETSCMEGAHISCSGPE